VVTRETGILVRPQDVASLGEAIARLLDNRDEAQAMGRRGRQQALDRFGWQGCLARLDAIYAGI
jgi:starch synthase